MCTQSSTSNQQHLVEDTLSKRRKSSTPDTSESRETTKHDEKWLEKYGLIVSFFIAIILCCCIYLYAVNLQQKNFDEGLDKIVSIYSNQASTLETKKTFQFIVPNHQKLLEEQEIFHDEIKALLELQQNRIQDNFEVFEIWAGILTIVFLVFSFFSLQKSEQMEQQSRNALKKIKQNMEASDTKLSDFDNEKNNRLLALENEKNKKLGELDTKLTEKLNNFATTSTEKQNLFESKSQKAIDAFTNNSTEKISKLDTMMEDAKRTVLSEGKAMIEEERNKAIASFMKQIDSLRKLESEDFKKIVEAYQDILKKDYELYRVRFEDLLNNPDDHIKDVNHDIAETIEREDEETIVDEEEQ